MTGDRVDLAAVAAEALGRPVRSASVVAREPLAYDPYLAGRSVERVSGVADLADVASGSPATWTAIVKRTDGGDVRAARRELQAYRSRIARPAEEGLGAPALLAGDEAGGRVELWLSEVEDAHGGRWPTSRYAVAAQHVAAWDVSRRAHDASGIDVEDAWAERHGQPHRIEEALARLEGYAAHRDAAAAAASLEDPGFRRTAGLINTTSERIARLHGMKDGLVHHDLVRSNLFAVGDRATVAIDWETIGPGPLGVDLAPLVVGSVRRGEASGDDLEVLERTVLDAYVATLARHGVHEEADVREAYRLALGLRWHVVLGTIQNLLDPTATRVRGSLPTEPRAESVRHLALLARHLLAAGEARLG